MYLCVRMIYLFTKGFMENEKYLLILDKYLFYNLSICFCRRLQERCDTFVLRQILKDYLLDMNYNFSEICFYLMMQLDRIKFCSKKFCYPKK